MTALGAMLLLGATCWVMRSLFISLVPAERLPDAIRQALDHLAPAMLAALVAVELAGATADLSLGPAALALGAMLAAGVVVRVTRNPLFAVAFGIAAALLLDLVVLG